MSREERRGKERLGRDTRYIRDMTPPSMLSPSDSSVCISYIDHHRIHMLAGAGCREGGGDGNDGQNFSFTSHGQTSSSRFLG